MYCTCGHGVLAFSMWKSGIPISAVARAVQRRSPTCFTQCYTGFKRKQIHTDSNSSSLYVHVSRVVKKGWFFLLKKRRWLYLKHWLVSVAVLWKAMHILQFQQIHKVGLLELIFSRQVLRICAWPKLHICHSPDFRVPQSQCEPQRNDWLPNQGVQNNCRAYRHYKHHNGVLRGR